MTIIWKINFLHLMFYYSYIYCETDEITGHVNWIIDNLSFLQNTKNFPKNLNSKINCVNFVAEFSFKNTINETEKDLIEETFVNTLLMGFFKTEKITIRYRNKFKRFYEPLNCDVFIFFSAKNNFCELLQKWSLTKRSNHLIAVLPADALNIIIDTSITNVEFWKKCRMMSHPEVVIFVNRTIYKMSHIFKGLPRNLVSVNVSDINSWNINRNKVTRNFKRCNIQVASTNCEPYQFWTYLDSEKKKIYPTGQHFEFICESKSDQNRSCCKYCECTKMSHYHACFIFMENKRKQISFIVNIE